MPDVAGRSRRTQRGLSRSSRPRRGVYRAAGTPICAETIQFKGGKRPPNAAPRHALRMATAGAIDGIADIHASPPLHRAGSHDESFSETSIVANRLRRRPYDTRWLRPPLPHLPASGNRGSRRIRTRRLGRHAATGAASPRFFRAGAMATPQGGILGGAIPDSFPYETALRFCQRYPNRYGAAPAHGTKPQRRAQWNPPHPDPRQAEPAWQDGRA